MKGHLMLLTISGIISNDNAQKNKPIANIERVFIEYGNKKVKAKKLTVKSEIPMEIHRAWANVKTPALLQFVAEGMIRFKSVEWKFPKQWGVGQTYSFRDTFVNISIYFYRYLQHVNYEKGTGSRR
jgi:hypothetical protein